jgi:glycosyltransferase involved in cell wall biosynthesis
MSPDSYNILFLSSWYPNNLSPQNGDFVQRHAKAVSLYSKVVCLHVIRDRNQAKKFKFVENSEGNFNEVLIYFNQKICSRLFYTFYYFKGYKYIKNKFDKPDIIHANVLYPIGIITYLISLVYRIPFVFTEHWTGYAKGIFNQLSYVKKKLYQFFGKKAKRILPVTNDLKCQMIKSGIKGKYKIVPNVVETEIFKIAIPKLGEVKEILHVSNLNDHHKNASGILRSIASLKELRQDFILNIIHSEENSDLVELSNSLGITDKYVKFCGRKDYDEVAKFMSNSAFLVLFSNYENLPCVIVEAFASGLPVLSSDVGGISDHLSEERGLLITKGDEKELVDKMNYMLDHCYEYDKTLMHEYAVDNFSCKNIGKKFMGIYKEILNV